VVDYRVIIYCVRTCESWNRQTQLGFPSNHNGLRVAFAKLRNSLGHHVESTFVFLLGRSDEVGR
jgi:hypothetical protein